IMEEGEIPSSGEYARDYDPSYEWPGDTSDSATPEEFEKSLQKTPFWPSLRLLVLRSDILSKTKVLAVIDEYEEVQFGRDIPPAGSETPRVRLKEMEVSKLHATAYWDATRQEWAVVDMGSKHGTFLSQSVESDDRVRLSPPRVASVPRPIRHLNILSIGSTRFVCHIHPDHIPCESCASRSGGDIPLFHKGGEASALKRSRDVAELDPPEAPSKDPRKALSMLKQSLLTRHKVSTASPSSTISPSYIDRSARRRALHPGSVTDAPGVSDPRNFSQLMSVPPHQREKKSNTPPIPEKMQTSSPSAAPLSDNNIGHRLLTKQGWAPGSSLGMPAASGSDDSGGGLIEPLELPSTSKRAGLGMPKNDIDTRASDSVDSQADWREAGRQRRWGTMRTSGSDR
ncbi:hypothetical protein CONPUDRAFT_51450, partial [Coniophora puteana RWD-64-598 SS2]